MNIPKGIKELVLEVGEFDKEHRKYSEFYATWELAITQEIIDQYSEDDTERAEWTPFVGLVVSATGMWSDSYGTEVDSWSISKVVAEESQMGTAFWNLMSHLNSEDNDMAYEFARKYCPQVLRHIELKDGPTLKPVTVAAMSIAKEVFGE